MSMSTRPVLRSERGTWRRRRLPSTAVITVFLLAGCGDDGSSGASPSPSATGGTEMSAGTEGEYAAYCAAVAAIDDSEEGPTPEMFDDLAAAAPAEISDAVNVAVGIFKASEGNLGAALSDPDAQAAFAVIEPVEERECGPSDFSFLGAGDTEAADGATVVSVATADFGFTIPDEVTAGSVAFEVTNAGPSGHEAFIAKLSDGVTLDDVLNFEGDPEAEGMAEPVGFAFVPVVGDTRVINADLTAGTYAIICFIPGPEGTPHAFLGMASEFTVTE